LSAGFRFERSLNLQERIERHAFDPFFMAIDLLLIGY
jgi:hypothetical protein